MSLEPVLLPFPRQLEIKHKSFLPLTGKFIQIYSPQPLDLLFTSRILSDAVERKFHCAWTLTASQAINEKSIAVQLKIDTDGINNPQGYRLSILPDIIRITAPQAMGIFNGVQTFLQLLDHTQEDQIPCVEIVDWPDFPVRGVLLDISRDKVYRMDTLYMLIDELASWKINQLQLYTEHTFAYQGHKTVWKNASPITPEEILYLDQYCSERFIELVPNQNSFGHMTCWLKHPAYQHLAETLQLVETPWGNSQIEPFSLAPTQPESLQFILGLFDQLLPNFSSKMVNVGCDETFDIGAGKSKAACEEKGKGQVYLDFLLSLYHDLSHRGYTIQFWGDIILQHPELVSQLPDNIIALDWGYEADHPFDTEALIFRENHIPFYVCPGTSSWNSLAGRVDNMVINCQCAAEEGLKNGAIGYILTDWGDNGHWQQLPISYPGFAAGAAFSWCLRANRDINLSEILNNIIFKDRANQIGDLMVSIGNEYQSWGVPTNNSSPLFWFLQENRGKLLKSYPVDLELIHQSLSRLENFLLKLDNITLNRMDADAIKSELRLTIQLMIHACRRCLLILTTDKAANNKSFLHEINELIVDFKRVWLIRNRSGGLPDSVAHFDQLIKEYTNSNE